MKVTIRDERALASTRPQELVAYLRSRGWHEHGTYRQVAGIWRRAEQGEDFEILVPMDPELADFAARIADALETLEAVERRSQLDILRDVATSMADVVRIPATRADLRDGSMPVNDGVAFFTHARELMMAAACSAIEPRGVFAARRPAPATQYLDRARFGQTERSSYVVTVVSPVPPRLVAGVQGEGTNEVEEPYERRVTTTLMRALGSAQRAADRAAATGNLAAFQEAVADGVSANLCDALVGLSAGCDAGSDLQVSIAWAPARPGPADVPRAVRVSVGAMPIFGEAARIFRATSPLPEFELHGFVSRLERAEAASEGSVTVVGLVEERPRKVELRLGEPDYSIAARAHLERAAVVCLGELRKRGSAWVLDHPRGFAVESAGE